MELPLIGTSVALSHTPFLLVVCILAKVAFLSTVFLRWRFPLSHIPGPKLAGWTRLWLIKALHSGRMPEHFVSLHKQHGPIVRIGPRHIIISDPESIRRVLGTGSKYTRGPWFDTLRLHPKRANVISERDPEKHQQLRHVLGPGLADKDARKMENTIDDHIRDWISMIWNNPVLDEKATLNLDLSKSIPYLTVDLISHLCLGESFGYTTSQTDKLDFLRAMRIGMIVQQYTSVLLEANTCMSLLGRLSFLRPLVFPTHRDDIGIGKTMQCIDRALKKSNKNSRSGEVPDNMLESFLARGLPEDQVHSEMIIILAGGTDTTATAAQGIIYSIISNSAVYSGLRVEIDTFRRDNGQELQYPIQEAMARKLPYLQACIFEGLRKYPPLFQLRERVTPPEGEYLHGHYIPGGTYVGINGLATQLDSVYGKDPQTFRPERWLIDDKARLRQMHRTLELVFGYGGSKCLGVKMAHMELYKIIYELFSHFDMSFANPLQPWKRTAAGIFVQSDFNVLLKRRVGVV